MPYCSKVLIDCTFKSSGKLLDFTDVFSIEETAFFFIRDDCNSVCKFSAESVYIERCP